MSRIEQLKEELANKLKLTGFAGSYSNELASAIITTIAPFLNLDKPEEEWPKTETLYWYIDSMRDVEWREWKNDYVDQWRKASNNIFRTEAEAQAHCDAILAGTVRVVVEKV
jgi:hypothetical protein